MTPPCGPLASFLVAWQGARATRLPIHGQAGRDYAEAQLFVMPGTRVRPRAGPSTSLVPGIHVCREASKAVDGRDKPGHDVDGSSISPEHALACGKSLTPA